MKEAMVENNIDLNSEFKLERVLLIDKICDKIDWTGYNPYRAQREVQAIEKMVNAFSFDGVFIFLDDVKYKEKGLLD